ncbi:MAG TPA: hypothetical protein VD998_03455 [Verrucomicrobiae bacterium]|nr:hypothetical protein [Verrucomicrobiae bacterium]
MDSQDKPIHKREEPKAKNPSEDLSARIKGLEKAKTYPEMTRSDIAALDRAIESLKAKMAARSES